jgi:antitoxin HicB
MIKMSAAVDMSLEEYLALEYPFQVIADPDGGYVVVFPDLPGCMTQADSYEEIAVMAQDARALWIETAYEHGREIPLPSYPEEYSGKFNVRLPRSLHRTLAESAAQEGISLNQYVTMLLARRDAQTQIERRVEAIEVRIAAMSEQTVAV